MQTIKTNIKPKIQKKIRVWKGAEVITSEEVMNKLISDKRHTKKSIKVLSKDDKSENLCFICTCYFAFYSDRRSWIQCITCMEWVCGVNGNNGSKKAQYECERCVDED